MTSGSSQNTLEVELPEGTSAIVITGTLSAQFSLTVNGQNYSMNTAGVLVPANDHQTPNLAQRVLEVGQRLRDGTVVLSVDLDKDEALFLPAKIFGGESKFDDQADVVSSVNNDALHGHSDWRLMTYGEAGILSHYWAKVTTQDPEWFWLAAHLSNNTGLVRCGGTANCPCSRRFHSYPVPVVRNGSARVCEPA